MRGKVKIAIVDTGIDKTHEYLQNNIIGGVAFESKDEYILVSDDYEDKNGHGTSCASIIKKEFEEVEFFIVKALDKFGEASIQVLEEALKYLLNIDVKIINLSLSVIESDLVHDLYNICEELNKQGKLIICSVANGFEFSYPAKFNNVIGVKGFILEDENSFWYNKYYDTQCIIDNNSYLRCHLNNSYKLFGKCNSQAAAKLAGKIAQIVSNNNDIKFDDLGKILEKNTSKNHWTNEDLEFSKRYPDFREDCKNISKKIIYEVAEIVKVVLNIDKDNNELYECSLFNRNIGLNSDNCFEVIKKLEKNFRISLEYMNISRYDFVSIYTLAELVERNMEKGAINMVILETINLTKKYGKGDTEVIALNSANILVEKGEFVAIIGPSGSGKSTMLHLLGGLERPTQGTVKIENQDIYKLSESELAKYRRKKIGFIFQQYNLIPVLNVRENIEMPLMLDKAKIDKNYIDELIEFLGLADRQKHLPNQLSGGQQQRVAIARALAAKPAIILADEPTGNLDTKTTEEVMDLLKVSIKNYNQTLIMITHNEKIAEKADRIISIVDGNIISIN